MKKYSNLILGAVFLAASAITHAAILTFDTRSAFESYVNNYTIDDLESIPQGSSTGLDRGDYAFTMQYYGCWTIGDCGDNTSDGMSFKYVWTYSDGSFNFVNPISAFGIDFAGRLDPNASVTLNGYTFNVSNGGFAGIVDTTGTFSSVSYAKSSSYGLFDNVTYGIAQPAPMTATAIPTLSEWGMIILSSLLALGAAFPLRRRRQ